MQRKYNDILICMTTGRGEMFYISIKYLVLGVIMFVASKLHGQYGYYDAPYVRYEADAGVLANGASATSRSFDQWSLQSEASEQVCVNVSNTNASVSWTVSAAGAGLVVRYSVPDGQTGSIEVLNNGTSMGTLTLTSYWSWESLWNNGNPNNVGVVNQAPKMRFDEVRLKMPSPVPAGGTLTVRRLTGNVHIDFVELEAIPAAVTISGGDAQYNGNGSDLQAFIDTHGGQTIYLPPGVYNVNNELYFGVNNTKLKGAGIWYTQIHFTYTTSLQGGLLANASGVGYSGLYLTTVRNSRSNSYWAIKGVYTSTSVITNIWAEHFECGAWFGQYNNLGSIPYADGFTMSYCRFRNNYADGVNLCRGTRNAVVEHCNFRNDGDDDMAIWSADDKNNNPMECQNNTYRYNTSENCWRSAGLAFYGGYNNKAHNLLIQDNVEVGVKVNNSFPGMEFSVNGFHEIYNIWIKRCGTFRDLYNKPVGAIDLTVYEKAGNRVQNVKLSCITISDSKNDAIYIRKYEYHPNSDGFYNILFENITSDGTGREYPDNGGTGSSRGHHVLFKNSPNGNISYCGMTYLNRGGNAGSDVNTADKGALNWTAAGTCPGGCVPPNTSSTVITSSSVVGVCTNFVEITVVSTPPSGNTINYMELFVDGASIGTGHSSPYTISWGNPPVGTYSVYAVTHYLPSGTTSTSSIQSFIVADGIYSTGTAPLIDGTIDALWNSYSSFPLNLVSVGTVGNAADLSASYKITRDATNLYILVDVTDDDLRNDSPEDYNDDAVELFIDMGNDKSGSYQADDYQYSFAYGDATPKAGLTFSQGVKTGGYIFEIRIPWASLSGAPANGDFIGIDVHVNDDDGGGTRDAKKAWYDGTDNAWQNPSLFGTLQVAGCASLPVELISFSGEIKNGSTVLNWNTASEINNEKFVIERSHDLIHWKNIGEVASAGNSAPILEYSFVDGVFFSKTYYRLRQVDTDGAVAYSHVVTIEHGSHVTITNPFDDILTIRGKSGEMEITIRDISGRLLYHTHSMNDGVLRLSPDLKPGMYLITIQSKDFVEQQKIIRK